MAVKPNASPLWRDIHETARIGATPRGGLSRLALSDEDRRVRDWLVGACREQGCAVRVDALGVLAGHDAVYVSRVAPTAMIFVPCRDGISHNQLESATAEHVEAGASVLLDSVLFRDRHPD